MISNEVQARAENLTLRVAKGKTGYFGVTHRPGRSKPYETQVTHGGKQVSLGNFATAEEAALRVARSLEEQGVAAERAAAAAPLTSEGARQQAQAEGLALRVADSKTGYFGVSLNQPGKPKPYQARVRCGGKLVQLGRFATAEEAALCVARSLEARPAAEQSLTRSAVPALYRTQEEGEEEAGEEEADLLPPPLSPPPLFFPLLLGWESFL